MNASSFVFDALPAALSHDIFIEWMGSLKDMAALDSACCSHACREILHQTWAEMPPCFPQEQKHISQQPRVWKWLHSRRLFICTTVTIDVAYIHSLLSLGTLPAFRSVSKLWLLYTSPRHRHSFLPADPTRADLLVKFFSAFPNLTAINFCDYDSPSLNTLDHVSNFTRHLFITHMVAGNFCGLANMLKIHGRTLKSLHASLPLQAISDHCNVLQELWLHDVYHESQLKSFEFLTPPLLGGLKNLHLVNRSIPLDALIWPMIPQLHNLEIMEIAQLRDIAIFAAFLQQCPKLQRFVASNFIELDANQSSGYDLRFKQRRSLSVAMSDHVHRSIFPKPVQKLVFECNSCTSDDAAKLLSHFGDSLLTVAYDSPFFTQPLESCKPVLQHVFANCPRLTRLYLERSVDYYDVAMIGNVYGQQLRALTIRLHDHESTMLRQHLSLCFAHLITLSPNLEHLAIHNAAAFPDHLFGGIFQHCSNLVTLQVVRELSDSMIAELVRWRGSRPLLFLSCPNMKRVAAQMRKHHKDAGTVNPWTCAGNSWCMCLELSCMHRQRAMLL